MAQLLLLEVLLTTGDGNGDEEITMGGAKRAIDNNNKHINLCPDAGLPIVEKGGQDGKKRLFNVAMKSVPINLPGKRLLGEYTILLG